MFSVIICTHNPDLDKFSRVLNSLQLQTLEADKWELIIVDNASTVSISEFLHERLHIKFKLIKEPEPGLTHARIAGIQMASHNWLVFVDDDNVLNANYLSESVSIINQHPNLGAFGCSLYPEFEVPPSKDIFPHLLMLAIRRPENDVIDSSYSWESTPFGAGMVVRKLVAETYVNQISTDPLRKNLDRKGKSLMSSGDIDLAHTAIDLGYKTGVFKTLIITHIIPSFRLTKSYMINMMKYNALSNYLLFYIRFKRIPRKPSFKKRCRQYARFIVRGSWFEMAMLHAQDQGRLEAIRRIGQLELNEN